MVFRCNMDGSEFEVLGHNFRNNYEVAVDSFGTLWQSDNDDDGNKGVRINYVMEHGNFGYTEELKGTSWGANWKRGQAKGASDIGQGSLRVAPARSRRRAQLASHGRGFAHGHRRL